MSSVKERLGTLALRNSQLVEKFDRAQVGVQRREEAARTAQAAAVQARRDDRRAHVEFTQLIQAQYESDNLGAAGALLDSSSGTNYLDQLTTLDMVSTHTAQVVGAVGRAREEATTAAAAAERLLAAARTQRTELARQRQRVEAQIRRYKTLLATLTAAQRAAYRRATNPSVSTAELLRLPLTVASSPAAHRAVEFALAQVGKPYVFGAAGPYSYDCSGLTMAAWADVGVSLPHSAAEQYTYGRHVSLADLMPGDLIFFYQPIGHVTIYMGNGLMVSAPTEGQDVSVVPLSAFSGDIAGATRLSG
ncbi:MAG TPA: C40 family peptidase [Gaiellales bacterium]|nr:C40 family peptidase [Gaiellales bacterium]